MSEVRPEACVVRIEREDGRPVGTGFVVAPDLVVTCSHVVEAGGAGPGGEVRLVFHNVGVSRQAVALKDGWHPDADVAFLRLSGSLPEGVAPAILASSRGREGGEARVFGFPEMGDVVGMWAAVELMGYVTEAGRTLLQIKSDEITVGFSGAPIWDVDEGGVIGMVVRIASPDRHERLGAVAFAIPVEALRDLMPWEPERRVQEEPRGLTREGRVDRERKEPEDAGYESVEHIFAVLHDLEGEDYRRAVLELEAILRDADENERRGAIAAVRESKLSALSLLERALEDRSSWKLRRAAVRVLEIIGDLEDVVSLVKALADVSKYVRQAAAGALGRLIRVDDLVSRVRDGSLDSQAALEVVRAMEDEVARGQALEGLAPHLPEELRKQVLGEARAAAQVPPVEPEQPERIKIATRALADSPSEVDLLGFSDYAEALADFIKNEKTAKPLTIGINAAWGMGKTTLMLMIRDQLTGQGEKKKKKRERSFPTVWFNAWKYDQEESLWAALALEILAQVRKQFNVWQRSWFWVELNWKRFDWGQLLQSVLKSLAYVLGIGFLGAVVFGMASLGLGNTLQESIQRLWQYVQIVGGVGFIIALFAAGKEAYGRIAGPFDLRIGQYVREPKYKERVGFLAQFEQDFKRVIDVVTEGGRWPLVVFIDDLDRCAPPKPAEIIEAINILLDAKHCVFVIGMDAQAVAGSIEAKYESLQSYLDDADDPSGLTLGQRFLEKIVQINFRIPRADPKLVESFVDANLDALGGKPPEKPREVEVSEAEQLIEAEQRTGKSLDEASGAVETARPDIPREAVAKARQEVFARSFDDSEEVRRAIHRAIQYLGLNPRKIKRFINIFRLQALIANRRGLLERREIRLDLLAKLVIIATRWPDLIAAMMGDPGFVNRLMQAYRTREDLREIESGRTDLVADPPESLKARLDVLTADPRIRRLIDAADLVQLLDNMTQDDIATLPRYLHLARITTEGSRLVRA